MLNKFIYEQCMLHFSSVEITIYCHPIQVERKVKHGYIKRESERGHCWNQAYFCSFQFNLTFFC